jgi:mannan polymerase II complex MNN10 subunit
MWDKTQHHLFSGMPGKGPCLNNICSALLNINKNYRFLIIGNTMLAYPHDESIKASPLLQACTISHLYNNTKTDILFLLDSERIISQASIWDVTTEGTEKKALEAIARYLGPETSTSHCLLWHALTLLQTGEYLRAYNHLIDIYEKGFTNSRIKLYLAQAAYGAALAEEGNKFTKLNSEYVKHFLKMTEQKKSKNSKIAIVGAHDKNYDKIGHYAHLNKLEYAKKHGYHVFLYTGAVDPLRAPYWYKITAIQKHLNDYEWIFWLDSDAIIMNHSIKLESIVDGKYEFICFKDCESTICSGSFLIKNTQWSKQFLGNWYAQQDVNIQPGFDNGALIKLYNESQDIRNRTKLVPQRILSSYPPPLCSPTGEYRTGDFIIHFAGITHKDKERLMKEYYDKQYALP